MKRPIQPAYTFSPLAGTLDLSAIAGFDLRRLFAVIDLKTGGLVYAPTPGYACTALAGGVLTLEASMAGLSAADPLMIVYDDGGKPAEDTSIQEVITAVTAVFAKLPSSPALDATVAATTALLNARLPVLAAGRTPVDGSGVVQPVSATALPLPTGAALDATVAAVTTAIGTDGAEPPTLPGGSTGVRGWLRSIAELLSGTLSTRPCGSTLAGNVQPLAAGMTFTVAGNPNRRGLRWMVTGPGAVSVAPGSTPPATAVAGMVYPGAPGPGTQGGFDAFEGSSVPTTAFSFLALADTTVVVWES